MVKLLREFILLKINSRMKLVDLYWIEENGFLILYYICKSYIRQVSVELVYSIYSVVIVIFDNDIMQLD